MPVKPLRIPEPQCPELWTSVPRLSWRWCLWEHFTNCKVRSVHCCHTEKQMPCKWSDCHLSDSWMSCHPGEKSCWSWQTSAPVALVTIPGSMSFSCMSHGSLTVCHSSRCCFCALARERKHAHEVTRLGHNYIPRKRDSRDLNAGLPDYQGITTVLRVRTCISSALAWIPALVRLLSMSSRFLSGPPCLATSAEGWTSYGSSLQIYIQPGH